MKHHKNMHGMYTFLLTDTQSLIKICKWSQSIFNHNSNSVKWVIMATSKIEDHPNK